MPGKREQSILTPQCIVDGLERFWPSGIAMDPCSAPGQLVVAAAQPKDGLAVIWPERAYCNPPYGELRRWLEHGGSFNEVVWLVPVRTHRAWFRAWWNLLDVRLGLDPLCFEGFGQAFPAPLMLGYKGARRDDFYLAFHQLGNLLDESVDTRKFKDQIMELKGRRHKGKCHVKDCKALSIASATSQSFFSARGKDVELCEEHLLEAQDMAARQGKELDWHELISPALIEKVAEADVQTTLKAELATEETEASGFLEELRQFSITCKEETEFAAELLAEVKGKASKLKAREKEITGPMNDALKATRALFKPALGFYAEAEGLLKSALAEAHKAAQAAQQAALDSHDIDGATEAASMARVEGVQYRSMWTFEITDANAIPREFCIPGLKLIADAVKKNHTIEIPGVRIYEDINVASKSV